MECLERRNVNIIKFTIGTASSSLEFEETMKLIKSSLLYADETELIGLVEYAVFCYMPDRLHEAKDIEQLLSFIAPFLRCVDVNGNAELLSQIDEISNQLKEYGPILHKKKRRSREEILAQLKIRQVFEQSKNELREQLQQFWDSPGSQAIKKLVERNIVSIHDYAYNDFDLDKLTGGYFGNLMNAIRSNTAYPLFDSVSEDVIRSVANAHILDIGRLDQEVLRHAGIASGILMTLPTLSSASVDEILAFKNENTYALTNFRKAIFEFSEKINSLPWDDNFQYDVVKLYSTEVAPKVEELNMLVSETSTLKNFGSKVLEDEEFRRIAGWAVGGIATTVVTQSGLMDAFNALKSMFLGLSLLTISPQIAMGFLKTFDFWNKSSQETQENKDKITGNAMYYYYKAKKEL